MIDQHSRTESLLTKIEEQVPFCAGGCTQSAASSRAFSLVNRKVNEIWQGVPVDEEKLERYEANTVSMEEDLQYLTSLCLVSDEYDGRPNAAQTVTAVIKNLHRQVTDPVIPDEEAEFLEDLGINVTVEQARRHAEAQALHDAAVTSQDELVKYLSSVLTVEGSSSFAQNTRQEHALVDRCIKAMERKAGRLAEQFMRAGPNQRLRVMADKALLKALLEEARELHRQIAHEIEAETDVVGEVH